MIVSICLRYRVAYTCPFVGFVPVQRHASSDICDASQVIVVGSVDAKVESVGMDATGVCLFVLKLDGDTGTIVTVMWHQDIAQ